MIFDSHAHYDDSAFDEDREELLSKMKEQGIRAIVNVGADLKTSHSSVELAGKYPYIYAAVGIHPEAALEGTEDGIKEIEVLSKEAGVVAIGEIGLDYHWGEPSPEVQKETFIKQLELAERVKLPVIIHSRDAAKETLDILEPFAPRLVGGVMHCFSYSPEIAREVRKMGFVLGIGGVCTFSNAKKMVEVIQETPLEEVLIETDCPYLAPVPYRGKRNCSMYLKYVVEKIAEIKGVTAEEVEKVTYGNAMKFYGIKE